MVGCHGGGPGPDDDMETMVLTDYHRPKSDLETLLPDDLLAAKAPEFDPDLVDRREVSGYRLNASAAVIKLDVPMLKPDADADLVGLYPSYRAALDAAGDKHPWPSTVLPSVNLIDGQAKQFDDGLYAALDLAYYRGLADVLVSHVRLVERIREKLDPESPAAPFLDAALSLAGKKPEVAESVALQRSLRDFQADEVRSKPIGFYTWSDDLRRCFRFLRFLQQPFPANQPAVPTDLAEVLERDMAIRDDYRKALDFYSRLTDPLEGPSLLDLSAPSRPPGSPVAFLPPSTSRENELFERLFPRGLPRDADLMREFIAGIRSGRVDLSPRRDGGWYDYQVYALETLLLPEKGREAEKLLFSASYKRRMLEAFQALMT
jgi:hypothetical protein